MTAGPRRWYWLALLTLAVVVTRIPLILTCYSSDPDAWRVAYVGKTFWETGAYEVSRYPGYPLHELITGPFVILGGAAASNTATLIAGLVLILVWYEIVRRESSSPMLLVTLLAFMPLFWIDSAATLDYTWSLLFILLSLVAAQRQRVIPSGILLGCAIGFRPSNAMAIIPILTLLHYTHTSRKRRFTFLLTAIATSLLIFTPVMATHGVSVWVQQTFAQAGMIRESVFERGLLFAYRAIYFLGPLATIGIVAILTVNRRKLWILLHQRDPNTAASLAGVVSFVLLFALFPLDRSYLLPVAPFLFLLIDKIASKRAMSIFAACIVSFAFVNPDVVEHARPSGRPGLNMHSGVVIEEWQKRNQLLGERTQIAQLLVKGKAVIMIGTSESFWFENGYVRADTAQEWKHYDDVVAQSKSNPDLHFVSLLSFDDVKMLQDMGYVVYCLDWVGEWLGKLYGYVPGEIGVKTISL
jgi:hypothetical protein